MAECAYCGSEPSGFPYTCNECDERHCERHRLPERHDCRGLARVSDRKSGSAFVGQSYNVTERDHAGTSDGGILATALDALFAPLRRLRR
ncbi:AN1-type zinc finger domain-containing protein [Haloarchaeobius sp. DFWS5]|uniref:AN1-type zinc finger domain-containing protein n=1 Tax=Haloarchaeobius sp. DFWS5 TaxID=3446114 RepID=UPI003EBAFB50